MRGVIVHQTEELLGSAVQVMEPRRVIQSVTQFTLLCCSHEIWQISKSSRAWDIQWSWNADKFNPSKHRNNNQLTIDTPRTHSPSTES